MKINIDGMSVREMQRLVYEVLTDNGMPEDQADTTVDEMSTRDLENFIQDCQE